MLEPLTPPDPVPNSDEAICPNCGDSVDALDIIETIESKSGCVNCIDQCLWCRNYYFREDLYDNPYLGYCCDACLHSDDYMTASRDEVVKDALRCLFFATKSKEIERLIITTAIHMEYFEFATELTQDKS